jgi:hypothetical protein
MRQFPDSRVHARRIRLVLYIVLLATLVLSLYHGVVRLSVS